MQLVVVSNTIAMANKLIFFISGILYSVYLYHTLHHTQFLHQRLQSGGIVKHHLEITTEQAVMRVDIDGAQHELLVLGDDARQIVHNADIIIAHDTQGDAVLRRALPTPLRLDNALTITASQFRRIRTVGTVDLDTAIDGDKAEY